MFSAAQTKLDIGKEMDAGKIILINNSKSVFGDEGAEFIGRFFVALIVRAAQHALAGRSAILKSPATSISTNASRSSQRISRSRCSSMSAVHRT